MKLDREEKGEEVDLTRKVRIFILKIKNTWLGIAEKFKTSLSKLPTNYG